MAVFRHSRELAATPDAVFDAFQDPARLTRWWGPAGFTNTFHHFDFTPGGSWRYTMHGPNGKDYPNESAFVEIVPNALVRLRHVNLPHYDLAITLEPSATGTLLTWVGVFENDGFAESMRDFLQTANEQNLDRLAGELAGDSHTDPPWSRERTTAVNPSIRPETPTDVAVIHAVTAAAFLNAPHTAHTEQFIVDALRAAGALAISLVAEDEGTIVGHVAVSPVAVSDGAANWYGLGPISVRPERQGQGIGSLLVRAAMHALRVRGAAGCTLAGDPAFYTRFGFAPNPGLTLSGVLQEYFLVLPFSDSVPKGVVTYHAAFETRGEAGLSGRHSGG